MSCEANTVTVCKKWHPGHTNSLLKCCLSLQDFVDRLWPSNHNIQHPVSWSKNYLNIDAVQIWQNIPICGHCDQNVRSPLLHPPLPSFLLKAVCVSQMVWKGVMEFTQTSSKYEYRHFLHVGLRVLNHPLLQTAVYFCEYKRTDNLYCCSNNVISQSRQS